MFDITAVLPTVYENIPLDEAMGKAAEAGVDGIELYEWESRISDIQEAARSHSIEVSGILVKNGTPSEEPAMADPDQADAAKTDLLDTIHAADELDCESVVVTVGPEAPEYSSKVQHRAIVDVLRAVADEAEQAGITLQIEPLNISVDHPGYYLTSTQEAVDIVRAVDSPNVQVLYDVYHMQVVEGDVITTIQEHIDHIGHFHIADVPGRSEPGTGELHYENIIDGIADTGYNGSIGCEYYPTGDADQALKSVVQILRRS